MIKLFHFLGGIYLAIALIALAAFAVIAGTFIESATDSHLLAAYWTYQHPFFQILLALFFVNILFSALRRWPFQKKHLPFLITHLGLLMIISGTMIKNRFGLQGQMTVWEGSGSNSLLIPHTYALAIEKKDSEKSFIPLPSFRPEIYFPYHYPELKCKIIGFAPHAKEKKEAWIKGNKTYISGVPSLVVEEWNSSLPFPKGQIHLKVLGESLTPINFVALKSADQIARAAYLQDLSLRIEENGHPFVIPLQEALDNPFAYGDGFFTAALDLSELKLKWKNETLSIPLQGPEALLVKPKSPSLLKSRFAIDLFRPNPTICFVQDEEITTLFAFDRHGRIHQETFDLSNLKSLISYDRGFGGYTVQAVIPFWPSRKDREKADALAFSEQLKEALSYNPPLSPPLLLLQEACDAAKIDFVDTLVQFLKEWKKSPGLQCHAHLEVLDKLNWNSVPKKEMQTLLWSDHFLKKIEAELRNGETLQSILKKSRWPFESPNLEEPQPLNLLIQQIFGMIDYLPEQEFPNEIDQASLLSSYFRLYGIDEELISSKEETESPQLILEAPLTIKIIPETPSLKIEDNRPGIVLEVQEGSVKQTIALAYDISGTGMKWPILNGNALIRFQPLIKELPYRIRLREARQIPYPQSPQIFSYECDILISEKGKPPLEQTLSMNHVHETWDGYRFYLSGVATSPDNGLKRIQLAVNYDPAKYFLTYPGAFLVFTGIILLFWIFPYRKT